jgi:hypothetical protein
VRLTDAAFGSKLHPFLERLRQEGVTDYFACPLRFTLGKCHFVSFASTQPGGFAEDPVRRLADLSITVERGGRIGRQRSIALMLASRRFARRAHRLLRR